MKVISFRIYVCVVSCILCFAVLQSCTRQGIPLDPVPGDFHPVKENYDQLKTIHLPATFTRLKWYDEVKDSVEKYKDDCDRLIPYANIIENKHYEGYIFLTCYGTPVLITFDQDLYPIDTLSLLSDAGLTDVATINKKLIIQTIDSVFQQFDISTETNHYEYVVNLTEIRYEKYQISRSGKIKMRKQKTKRYHY